MRQKFIVLTVGFLSLAATYVWTSSVLQQPLIQPTRNVVSLPDPPRNEIILAANHPIVPGGIHCLADLKRALRDPLVAKHYRDMHFDVSNASFFTLAENSWARVSYRNKNGIGFTQSPVLLLAGEKLIEDGHGHFLRSLCGNSIAFIESTPDTTDTAVNIPLELPPDMSNVPTESAPTETPVPQQPFLPPLAAPVPPSGYYPPVPCCIVVGGGSPPKSVPEPETVTLLAAGIVAVIACAKRLAR